MYISGMSLHFFSISNVRLAKLQGALDAIEAVKTGVEQHARMAEKTAIQFFSSLRAALDSREQAVLKVPPYAPWKNGQRSCEKRCPLKFWQQALMVTHEFR